MQNTALTCLALIAFLAQFGCGGTTDVPTEAEFDCPATGTVAAVSDLNYPSDCETATDAAVGQLDSGHYLRACEQAAPGAPPPPAVTTAHVTECRPTEDRGVFLDVEVCCPEPVAIVEQPASVFKADGPDCPTWRTRARAGDLHYPGARNCAEVVPGAEENLTVAHYRKACTKAAPRATRPVGVLDARVVECRSGGGTTGVVVDVELCCDVKVFEESEFRELVWQRPIEEVRAALGEPLQVTEWPQGTHWNYPFEVARDDKVFPDVTVVIVDDRVESYHFGLVDRSRNF